MIGRGSVPWRPGSSGDCPGVVSGGCGRLEMIGRGSVPWRSGDWK